MKQQRDFIVLGVSDSHNASACLMRGGEILGAISEERITRQKNPIVYPQYAIDALLKEYAIAPSEIDLVALNFQRPITFAQHYTPRPVEGLYRFMNRWTYRSRIVNGAYEWMYALCTNAILNPRLRAMRAKKIQGHLGITTDRIVSYPHFETHVASVVYGFLRTVDRETLVLTSDGAGDAHCASVNIVRNGEIRTLRKIENRHSLAALYGQVTRYLGMKVNEHEYKVMGLAPYADADHPSVIAIFAIFQRMIRVEGSDIISSMSERHQYEYIRERLEGYRFDYIACAIQSFIEWSLSAWVRNCIQEIGIADVAVAGGIFMNVKANKAIGELPEIRSLTVMPSASDETTAIGAAYLGHRDLCHANNMQPAMRPLKHLYLGNTVLASEVASYLRSHGLEHRYRITVPDDIEETIATLLSQRHIVARVKGRMEFGARALGNRSILAHPSFPEIVTILNRQIKCRDFWMPFAGSVLAEREDEYLVNPKRFRGAFMEMSFDTTEKARKEMSAAMHPVDKTMRPQIVTKEANPSYHRLMTLFREKTGIGGVLNTSLNIHGEPIVCSLADAVHTLECSGLQFLALEGMLIEKCS